MWKRRCFGLSRTKNPRLAEALQAERGLSRAHATLCAWAHATLHQVAVWRRANARRRPCMKLSRFRGHRIVSFGRARDCAQTDSHSFTHGPIQVAIGLCNSGHSRVPAPGQPRSFAALAVAAMAPYVFR